MDVIRPGIVLFVSFPMSFVEKNPGSLARFWLTCQRLHLGGCKRWRRC